MLFRSTETEETHLTKLSFEDDDVYIHNGVLTVMHVVKKVKHSTTELSIYSLEKVEEKHSKQSKFIATQEYISDGKASFLGITIEKIFVSKGTTLSVAGWKEGESSVKSSSSLIKKVRKPWILLAEIESTEAGVFLGEEVHHNFKGSTTLEIFFTEDEEEKLRVFQLDEDLLKEYYTDYNKNLHSRESYMYSMLCDRDMPKRVYSHWPFVMLHCFNSTEDDGVTDDGLLVWVKGINVEGGAMYPVQQFSVPDIELPTGRILTFIPPSSAHTPLRFLMSTHDSLYSQWALHVQPQLHLNPLPGPSHLAAHKDYFTMRIQNIVESASTRVTSKDPTTLPEGWPIFIPVAAYFILLSCVLVYIRNFRYVDKESDAIVDEQEEFTRKYKQVMRPESLEERLIIPYQH